MKVFSTTCALVATLATACAAASVITVTFPAFTGVVDGPPTVVGTRAITIPAGERIIAAQVSGSFGPGDNCSDGCPGSDPATIRIDSIDVASCHQAGIGAGGCGNLTL